jgi:prepilin-type N-terminal cleavage/methylation domain-containing protein
MRRASRQFGFTIIELMIATAIFSLVLLICLTAITQIGRMYYKGITTSRTQELARSIIDEISQQIQFSGRGNTITGSFTNTTSGTTSSMCIGPIRYTMLNDRQVSKTNDTSLLKAKHALWRDEGSCPAPSVVMTDDLPSTVVGGAEIVPENFRILNLSITPASGATVFAVTVRVAYGDQDLLDLSNGFALATCKGSQIGTQFCAVSELSTTVTRRVQ